MSTISYNQQASINLKMAPEFKEVIENLKLSNEERDSFLALLDNPPEPTEKAKMAMRKYLKERKILTFNTAFTN